MKKSLLSVAAIGMALLFTACNGDNANKVTLDLSQITTPAQVEYSEAGVWTGTYSTEIPYIVAQCFRFSHLPSGENWGGTSWEGFTLSKVATNDAADPFACVAKGGKAGEGTPYILAYYSAFYGEKSNIITFDVENTPQFVYICQTSQVLDVLKNGNAYARAFENGDYLTLKIEGLSEKQEAVSDLTYYLADFRDGKNVLNEGWEKVDLTSLGNCYGLRFTMNSTDVGEWGINTPTYFALDGLCVKEVKK